MATETRPWTRADLERLPDDGNRYEVLDGQLLVTPQAGFPHQVIATRLVLALGPYCEAHAIGAVVGPGAVIFEPNELQPDVQVVPGRHGRRAKWTDLPLPILVIEVRSDSTFRRDAGIKRNAYVRVRIPEYWMVDGDARTVTVVRPGRDDTLVQDTLRWQPDPGIPPLEIPLDEIFK